MRHDTASRIVVNGRFLARRLTGVERYGHEILRCISDGVQFESTRLQGWSGHAWEQFILPGKLKQDCVLWSPANTGPLTVRRQALTIHDLSPLEHPEWFRAGFAIWYRLLLPMLAKRVQRVFTPSEYVKHNVTRRFGIREVTVTRNGVDHTRFHPCAKQTRFALPQEYVLFVGTLEPRKNLRALLDAWSAIKHEFKNTWLMIVGVGGSVFKTIQISQKIERVRFLGYVDDETLAGLYANASLFVLPSQDEGFGLPAIEAMASGTPVIVSDGGALPEVVGDAGLRFCLSTPNGLANTMKEGLGDKKLRDEMREKGLERARRFSWQRTADIVWESLHDL